MRVKYTNDKKVHVILISGECGKNTVASANLYERRYPDRRYPSDQIFRCLEKTLRRNWPKETRNRGLTATGVENEIRVIEAVENDPYVS
ncbi:hypothetical protein Zmor_006585 [Zophobas morio]|uniref:DUF4817 domain-containing protein n=1 Tax=Zophobas morio TaxID=2755281 RepID=A0AA38MNA1_9CUCU|nr:hypothetical protein Zmor_006585 [Zophobas morio]